MMTGVNPMVQMLMPLCQSVIHDLMQSGHPTQQKPLSIQLDEQFAAMAERYFDNLYDGREEVPRQFKELVRRCCCEATLKHEHAETQQHVSWKQKSPHRVFMAAVDKIIEHPSKADEIIDEHFAGVTDDERRVLKLYAKGASSTKETAHAAGMTEELYFSRLENLMNKVK